METFDIRSLFKAGQEINPVIRILAIPVAALFLVGFAYQIHALAFEPRTTKSALLSGLSLLLSGYLLWPLSYVAIKGKSPKAWHPH